MCVCVRVHCLECVVFSVLLEIVEELKPLGIDDWKDVAQRYYELTKVCFVVVICAFVLVWTLWFFVVMLPLFSSMHLQELREAGALRRYFRKLARTKPKTGALCLLLAFCCFVRRFLPALWVCCALLLFTHCTFRYTHTIR